MAQVLSIDLAVALLTQQYGTANTADTQRGVVAQRQIKHSVSTLTRSVVVPQVEVGPGENREIDLGSMTQPRFILVESDKAVEIRISADGEAIPLVPLASTLPGVLALTTDGIAGLWIERSGEAADAATVAVLVVGIE